MDNTNYGCLRVKVSSGDGAIPIENAIVLISGRGKEGEDTGVLYSLRTDDSGLTQKVSLPTKNIALSQTPNNFEPFISYNIEVKKEGYYGVNNMNVSVFEGVCATLPVDLVPQSFGKTPYDYDYEENRVFNDFTGIDEQITSNESGTDYSTASDGNGADKRMQPDGEVTADE